MEDDNEVIIPAIYKHFKGGIFATMGISNPVSGSFIEELKLNIKCRVYMAMDKEINYAIEVYKLNGEYYHHKIKNKKCILYKSLCDDKAIYIKDIELFLSEVDTKKYPSSMQKYKFQLMRY